MYYYHKILTNPVIDQCQNGDRLIKISKVVRGFDMKCQCIVMLGISGGQSLHPLVSAIICLTRGKPIHTQHSLITYGGFDIKPIKLGGNL